MVGDTTVTIDLLEQGGWRYHSYRRPTSTVPSSIPNWAPVGPKWGPVGAHLGPTGAQLGPIWNAAWDVVGDTKVTIDLLVSRGGRYHSYHRPTSTGWLAISQLP